MSRPSYCSEVEGGGDLRDLKLLSPRGDRTDSEGHVFGENHVDVDGYDLIVYCLSDSKIWF